jgi:hypothetical protein
MTRGRPPLPTGTQLVILNVRIPAHVRDFYKTKDKPSEHIRVALEKYMKEG